MKIVNEVSNTVGSNTDTEPDFGNFLSGGRARKFSTADNDLADSWFTKGGYTQTDFPVADDMWGGNYSEMSTFDLDPGLYRVDSTHKFDVPIKLLKLLDSNLSGSDIQTKSKTSGSFIGTDLIDDLEYVSPKYTDFFEWDDTSI